MDTWRIGSVLSKWRLERRLNRDASRIAEAVFPELWENVRKKLADKGVADLVAYARLRAAQIVQPHVERIVLADPSLAGADANRLILKSAAIATESALGAVQKFRRSAA